MLLDILSLSIVCLSMVAFRISSRNLVTAGESRTTNTGGILLGQLGLLVLYSVGWLLLSSGGRFLPIAISGSMLMVGGGVCLWLQRDPAIDNKKFLRLCGYLSCIYGATPIAVHLALQ